MSKWKQGIETNLAAVCGAIRRIFDRGDYPLQFSVLIWSPGWQQTTVRLLSVFKYSLFASSFVKRMFESFELPYAFQAVYAPFLSSMRSSRSIALKRCADDATLMILAFFEFSMWSKSWPVRAKWPKWFMPICFSNPSSVVSLFGIAITPALFTKILISYVVAINSSAHFRTLSKLFRSREIALVVQVYYWLWAKCDEILLIIFR